MVLDEFLVPGVFSRLSSRGLADLFSSRLCLGYFAGRLSLPLQLLTVAIVARSASEDDRSRISNPKQLNAIRR